MNSLFYCVSMLALFVLCCIGKKSEKKIDIIPIAVISMLGILSYQVLLCWGFSFLNVSITLVNLGIANILVCTGMGWMIKKKGIQSFSFSKQDITVILILIILISVIAYQDVGNLENIRYSSTDAGIHYIAAKEFYQNDTMLNKVQHEIETDRQMMPMAYINVGILFKVFAPLIGEVNLYKIFVLFDITIFSFSGILFCFILKEKIKGKWDLVLAVVMTILYLLGYPLNNLLSGFYYLGVGCLMINAILYILQLQMQSRNVKRSILFLVNTGLILSYSLFAPVVYVSEFIYEMMKEKANKKELILDVLITLVIPGILGVIYLLVPDIERVKGIVLDGYIYKSLWKNIIFFIPFAGYSLFKKVKENKIDYLFIYFVILILFIGVVYLGTKVNIISHYYFYKNAYILWAILLIFFFEGIQMFIESHQKQSVIAIVYIVTYVLFLSFGVFNRMYVFSMFDIYQNNDVLLNRTENLKQDDVTMLNYIKQNEILSSTENNTLFIGDFMQEAWIRSIFAYRNRDPLEKGNHEEYIRKWNEGEFKYLVCFEESKTYKKAKDLLELEEGNIIFQTEKATLYAK